MIIENKEEQDEDLTFYSSSSRINLPTATRNRLLFIVFVIGILVSVAHMLVARQNVLNHIAEQKKEIAKLDKELKNYDDVEPVNTETTEEGQTATEGTTVAENTEVPATEEPKDAKTIAKETAEPMLNALLNWSDYTTYINNRNTLISTYGADPASDVFIQFMPEVTQEAFGNLNMKLKDFTPYVLQESDGVTSYAALCYISSNVKGRSGNGKVMVLYQITADGAITNIRPYTLAN